MQEDLEWRSFGETPIQGHEEGGWLEKRSKTFSGGRQMLVDSEVQKYPQRALIEETYDGYTFL